MGKSGERPVLGREDGRCKGPEAGLTDVLKEEQRDQCCLNIRNEVKETIGQVGYVGFIPWPF